MAVDPLPIQRYAQTGSVGHGDAALGVRRIQLVQPAQFTVDGRFAAGNVGVHQAQFVIVGVTNRGHTMTVGQTAAVQLYIQPVRFGQGCDLHNAGNTAIHMGVGAHVIRGAVSNGVGLGLQTADVLSHEHGSLDQLFELHVGKLGKTATPERVFVPHVGGLVAGASYA